MIYEIIKYCYRSISILWGGFFIVSLLSLFLSPIIAFIINITAFTLIIIAMRNLVYNTNCGKSTCHRINSLKDESDKSRVTISLLKKELIKVNTIDKIQLEKNQIQLELSRVISYNHHLSGVIAGLNHEITPWISGIYLLANMLKNAETDQEKKDSLLKIEMAAEHTEELLSNLSKSVNKLKNFSVFKSNIKDTVASWIQIVLLEKTIKEKISKNNITIDLDSLNFVAEHSPMYLSQIILNLTKNSIDHNGHMLENLKIKIYGNKESKYLIYEDNGKGIPDEIASKVFSNLGITTKKYDSGEIHGIGLYSCLNYCLSMNATIKVYSKQNVNTKFIIKFERINEDNVEKSSSEFNYFPTKE